MVDLGANFKATDNDGKTPYDIAVQELREEVAEYLKEINLTIKLKEDNISDDEKK